MNSGSGFGLGLFYITDDVPRNHMFEGGMFLYFAPAVSTRIVVWAPECVTEGFGCTSGVRRAHLKLPGQEFAETAGAVRSSRFTSAQRTKEPCRQPIAVFGGAGMQPLPVLGRRSQAQKNHSAEIREAHAQPHRSHVR
jgi:hypothetical protein